MADPLTLPFGFSTMFGTAGPRKLPPFRPFEAGEQISNPDGSYSTEVSITIEDGNGGYMVVPQLLMGQSGVVDLRDKPGLAAGAATHLRDSFGIQFPTFKTLDEANAYAANRSRGNGAFQGPIGLQLR